MGGDCLRIVHVPEESKTLRILQGLTIIYKNLGVGLLRYARCALKPEFIAVGSHVRRRLCGVTPHFVQNPKPQKVPHTLALKKRQKALNPS